MPNKIAAALVAGLLAWAAAGSTSPALAQAGPPAETAIAASVAKADFADLYTTLQASHFNLYARRSKVEYDALYNRMLAEFGRPMSRAELVAKFQSFVAYGRIAHARIDEAGAAFRAARAADAPIFPLEVRVVDGRMFVVRNGSGLGTIAAGDEILALNGEPASRWLARAGTQISADTPYMLGAMLEWDFPRVVWTTLGSAPSFDLKLARTGGKPFDIAVPARSRTEIATATAKQPPTLDLSWEKREARMLGDGIAYLRPGPTYNVEGGEALMYDNASFKRFIDAAFESFIAAGARDLIIDLRNNPGGDNSFSDLMVAWFASKPFAFNSRFQIKVSEATTASNQKRLQTPGNDPTGISAVMAKAFQGVTPGTIIDFPVPQAQPRDQRFGGKVYALVNRHSYSNTVAIAATIQDDRFGVILGEETSDLATTFGAMERFSLPRSELAVGYPKALIVRPSGDLTPRGVVPDVAIVTPIVEGVNDPVLAQALEIVRSRR